MHFISWLLDEVTLQSFPSTVTVLFVTLLENPVPDTVRYCPPIFPLDGETEVTVGRAVN